MSIIESLAPGLVVAGIGKFYFKGSTTTVLKDAANLTACDYVRKAYFDPSTYIPLPGMLSSQAPAVGNGILYAASNKFIMNTGPFDSFLWNAVYGAGCTVAGDAVLPLVQNLTGTMETAMDSSYY